ncbi:carbohydrate ABC transporter permease [Thermoactinospora rubra]|uniref:carbohydrate ABC transporter permease n=1 Tax=Thermoactinospora rubra TaxID=1088767 RepID=UPI001F0B1959|nr:carbohydrate ABC transporter permease [Thermoactinospora rubra]
MTVRTEPRRTALRPAPGAPPGRTPARAAARRVAARIVHYLLLLGMLVVLIGPFAWQLSTSLKGTAESVFSYPPDLWPDDPTLANYAKAAQTVPVWRYGLNSLIVALGSALTNCLFGAMAGYALARMRFRGRKVVFAAFLATMIIPFEVIMVSVFLTSRSLGLVDTLLGVLLPTAVTGLSVLLLRNGFRALPVEVEEAAMLDGAGEWQRFWRVALPSVRGTLTVVAIFSFVFSWDDFLWPLIVLSSPRNYTLTVGIQYLSGTFTADQRVIAAGTMIAVLPLLALFFALQRFFFRGVGEGAVKG